MFGGGTPPEISRDRGWVSQMPERTIDRVNQYFERMPKGNPKTTSDNGYPPLLGSITLYCNIYSKTKGRTIDRMNKIL